jgi:hypothetical protein
VIVLDFDLQKETDPIWLNYYLTPAARTAINSSYRVIDSLQVPEPEKLWQQDRFYIYIPRFNKFPARSSVARHPSTSH